MTARKKRKPPTLHRDRFLSGVFSAMQYLVVDVDQPQLAKELAEIHGIDRSLALKESRLTGFEVRKMNRFIRQELAQRRAL